MQGADTEQPILRVGDEFFEGRFVDTVGTDLFFAVPPHSQKPLPPVSDCYVGQSSKRLVFTKVVLQPRDTTPQAAAGASAAVGAAEETKEKE